MPNLIFDQWQDGLITPQQAVDTIMSDIEEIEDTAKRAETERKTRRSQLELIIAHAGEVTSHGRRLYFRRPSTTTALDEKAIDALVHRLLTMTDVGVNPREVAGWIAGCKMPKDNPGSFVIGPAERKK